MKLLAHYIKAFWFYFFGNPIDKINLKLEKAALDATLKRYQLKKTISKDLSKSFGISFSKRSKFIPAKGHNKTKIYKYIYQKFGNDLIDAHLVLTKTLNWK